VRAVRVTAFSPTLKDLRAEVNNEVDAVTASLRNKEEHL